MYSYCIVLLLYAGILFLSKHKEIIYLQLLLVLHNGDGFQKLMDCLYQVIEFLNKIY